jgi:hypothetical protein
MNATRKRAPGAGRKPKGDKAMPSFTWRMPADMRSKLEAAAKKNGLNLSDELLRRVRTSFSIEREQERDPALRALNFVIAQLAERISSGMYVADRKARLLLQEDWRTDPFKFAAFKFAVGKLLDALDPPEPEYTGDLSAAELAAIKKRARQESEKWAAEKFGPEFVKIVNEIHKTPEAYGSHTFGALWDQLTRTNQLTEKEKEMARRYPSFGEVMEREFYGFEKARRDLGIETKESQP